jgi:hypothetical protein
MARSGRLTCGSIVMSSAILPGPFRSEENSLRAVYTRLALSTAEEAADGSGSALFRDPHLFMFWPEFTVATVQ